MLDVRNLAVQRREYEGGMRFCLLASPCQVWAHRGFTPCIVSVFPLSRVLQRGTFHSTGISRFIARPGPVPLQSPHLNCFCYTTWKVMSQISDDLKRFPCEIKGL